MMNSNAILIQSTEKVNFATHDNNLTTNREETGKEEDTNASRRQGPHDNMRTTASGTLSNLIQSIKDHNLD